MNKQNKTTTDSQKQTDAYQWGRRVGSVKWVKGEMYGHGWKLNLSW